MSCVNCTCERCEEQRERDRAFGRLFPCERCGEPGMSRVTAAGQWMHKCPAETDEDSD